MEKFFLVTIFISVCSTTSAFAGGIIRDSLSAVENVVAPRSNIGKPLDDLKRDLKQKVPVYGNVEDLLPWNWCTPSTTAIAA